MTTVFKFLVAFSSLIVPSTGVSFAPSWVNLHLHVRAFATEATALVTATLMLNKCPACDEMAHPRYSNAVLCGLGRCPVAKHDSKCSACGKQIHSFIDNIACVSQVWLHKACAVAALHPAFLSVADYLTTAYALTTDLEFRGVITQFFKGQGHYIASCSPGSGKTTVGSIITRAIGAKLVVNLMFNKNNVLDAQRKGITMSYTYHSITASALLRYLRMHVAMYANSAQNNEEMEDITLTQEADLLSAIIWTLYPPEERRDLHGDETPSSIASAVWVLFTDTVVSAVNMAMQLCIGMRDLGFPADNDRSEWQNIMHTYQFFEDLHDKWDDKKLTNNHIKQLETMMGNADPHEWLETFVIDLAIKVFLSSKVFFWSGHIDNIHPQLFHINKFGKDEVIAPGTLTYTQMPYFAVLLGLQLLPLYVMLIIVEEFQDVTPLYLQVIKLVLRDAMRHRRRDWSYPRILALGDMKQAITYFQGSLTDALRSLMMLFGMVRITLRVTKRLPKLIVKYINNLMTQQAEIFIDETGSIPYLIARYEAPEGIHVENANMRDHAPPLEQKVLFAGRNNKECKQFFGLLVQRKYDVGLSINGTMITVCLANLSMLNPSLLQHL